MIRLYAGENVDDRIARGLRLHRIDIVTLVEAGMLGKPDPEQLSHATSDGRVLLTSDQDFWSCINAGRWREKNMQELSSIPSFT
jgi:predicted nuclease of predicted toxin-antitoxin system